MTGLLIVGCGMLGSFFYTCQKDFRAQKQQLNTQLQEAQHKIAELEEEKALLLEEVEVVTVMQEDGEAARVPKLGFTVDLDDWKYLVVNERTPLEKDFTVELAYTRNSQRVDARIKKELEEMIDDARKDGIRLTICSSFRTFEKQTRLMQNAIRRYEKQGMDYREAFFKAKERTALTGASEHHTGLAVDIVGSSHQSLDRAQANTKEAKWLNEHAHEYGFVLRYPADKEEQTGILFESWHYRYVGKEAAAYMKENNLCLEEFVELVQILQADETDRQVNRAGR